VDLILWRHAEAASGDPDAGRPLTPRGRDDAARIAGWLLRHLPASARIVVSPAMRAQQTAAALGRPFETIDALAPGATARAVLEVVRWPGGGAPVLVVAHQPTLGVVAARLVSRIDGAWTLDAGAVCWLASLDDDAAAEVRVALSPRHLQ
jgi:phosphohistidine phosphatase